MKVIDILQGSKEWLDLRKTKITATDSAVIIGANPWKTPLELYEEKLSSTDQLTKNAAMQRGIDLEPAARELFIIKTGIIVKPAVVVEDWAMASLDGLSEDQSMAVEIKCPGAKGQDMAKIGVIPDYYYPQLQHQMMVLGIDQMYYFSFDGIDGVVLTVIRNDEYIANMAVKEKEFYDCVMTKNNMCFFERQRARG